MDTNPASVQKSLRKKAVWSWASSGKLGFSVTKLNRRFMGENTRCGLSAINVQILASQTFRAEELELQGENSELQDRRVRTSGSKRTSGAKSQNFRGEESELQDRRVRTSGAKSQNFRGKESELQGRRVRTSGAKSQNFRAEESELQDRRVRTSGPKSQNVRAEES
ncbi:octapeptide-repeat protein T2-like [Elysia marginata]|uniref:Octapeptide-repeat protein T2-like n=1 Tax=Elysia marginata TaxID=1093978 RepID=A0AAV4HA49_9GAST|nr:octapeptide-repeat protein T2-like [Elysia marginata]